MLFKESGPWASVIANDAACAEEYASQDIDRYLALVDTMGRTLFDRDSVPGMETEESLAMKTPSMVIPGWDEYHTQLAARFVQECLPNVEYWDATVEQQTASASLELILEFLNLQSIKYSNHAIGLTLSQCAGIVAHNKPPRGTSINRGKMMVKEAAKLTDFLGSTYNYVHWVMDPSTQPYFRNEIVRAGQPAPDFTLEDINGNPVNLADFRGMPLMIEFGSIT